MSVSSSNLDSNQFFLTDQNQIAILFFIVRRIFIKTDTSEVQFCNMTPRCGKIPNRLFYGQINKKYS